MRWIVILIVVGLAIFFFMNQNQDTPRPAAPPAPPAATATPEATPAPTAPPAPAPAAQPATNPSLLPRMQQVAQQTGVQLTGFQPQQPGSAWIGVAWRGDNKALGGDFLEALQRQGLIRDFDVDNAKYGMTMQNGAPVNTAQFLVRF